VLSKKQRLLLGPDMATSVRIGQTQVEMARVRKCSMLSQAHVSWWTTGLVYASAKENVHTKENETILEFFFIFLTNDAFQL
jgi:hypothetical protein